MFETFKNAWKIPEVRTKILFTLLTILIYRIGCKIPVPGVDVGYIADQVTSNSTFLGLFNVMSGGAFESFAVFALGITPYINASIILNLLTMVVPALERLSKEGEEGRKKISTYERYLTVVLALIMAVGFTLSMREALIDDGIFSIIFVVVTLTAGSTLLMWLGERATEKGIGNGTSVIIFVGIVSRVVPTAQTLLANVSAGTIPFWVIPLLVIGVVLMFAAIVFIDGGERKIQVNYAKRVVGRKMYGGQSTYIPMKVNASGVLPIIFAVSVASLPQMIAGWVSPESGFATFVAKWLSQTSVIYLVVYALLIVFFSYFYSQVSFNPIEVSKNLKENGGFVTGIRPGKPTSDYLMKILSRITLVGALYLAAVAILPIIVGIIFPQISNMAIGGSSVMILVSVALETTNQLESQILMRNYKGFLK